MYDIDNILRNVKEKESLKSKIQQLNTLKLSDFMTDEEVETIDKEIEVLQNQLGRSTQYELSEIDRVLNEIDLDICKVENVKFEYLYENFIVKNEVTMFAAPPASGKSLMAVAFSNYYLLNNGDSTVLYFDADNGITTIKNRNIHVLKQKFQKRLRYIHESGASKMEMKMLIKKLQQTNLSNVLIVFDSIKNFISGDRDKNKDVSVVMEILKSLRRQGATVIFLHHTNKPQKDIEELTYAGSSAWEEDTANAFMLKKNEHRNTFIFRPLKARTGDLHELAFTYNAEYHIMHQVDLRFAKESRTDEEIRKEITSFIRNSEQKPVYSQILKNCEEQGHSKDKINAVIQNGKGTFWLAKRQKENNKDEFELITIDKSDKSCFWEFQNNMLTETSADKRENTKYDFSFLSSVNV